MAFKALVTGSGGFIGSHLVEHLVQNGFDVLCMLRYNSRNSVGNLNFLTHESRREIKIIRGDLKDPDFCSKAVKDITHIFHLGALIAIPYSYINPIDFFQTNILGTSNLLQAALREGEVERFIHLSTSEVYGTAIYRPIDEKHPIQSQSPYAASKISADSIVNAYFRSYDLPITIVRPFNTYGPRQSERAVIPAILSQLIKKNELEIGSLVPRRDFLYIKDTITGIVSCSMTKNTIGETLNLGTGQSISIGVLLDKICLLIDKKPKVIRDLKRIRPDTSEVFHLEANIEKVKLLTGWKPVYPLEQGLQETVTWYKENPEYLKGSEFTL
jgi:NAD dependent epimerase/dehydratase